MRGESYRIGGVSGSKKEPRENVPETPPQPSVMSQSVILISDRPSRERTPTLNTNRTRRTDADPTMNHTFPPDPDPMTVEVSDTQPYLAVDPEALAALVRQTLAAERVARATISVALVDDATIRQINRRHLGHDWPTDVISFPLSEPGDEALSGELVVSAERAATTARHAGVSAWDELALYVVHGLLHLCGHDDAADEDRDAMRRREEEILAHLGLSNTFPAGCEPGHAEPGPDTEAGGRERARWTG